MDLQGEAHKLCVGGYYGSRTVDLGDRQTIALAREILRELVLAWQAKQVRPASDPAHRKPRAFPCTVMLGGRSWTGNWTLENDEVCLSCAYGSKRAPVKRTTPQRVAERLLTELVKAWLARCEDAKRPGHREGDRGQE